MTSFALLSHRSLSRSYDSLLNIGTAYVTEASPTPTRSAAESGLSKDAKAGVAVAATLAAILILSLVMFFVWRRYRKRSGKKEVGVAARAAAWIENSSDINQRPELNSDSYYLYRKELEGSVVPLKARSAAELLEAEQPKLSKAMPEMSANEVAAAELESIKGSRPSWLANSSTFVDSSVRHGGGPGDG